MTVGAATDRARQDVWPRKALLALTAVVALVFAMLTPMAPADASAGGKITFCHATNSAQNPYVVITTDPASIVKRGHTSDAHQGPVFNTGDPHFHTQDNRGWGDVIPPFEGFAGTTNVTWANVLEGTDVRDLCLPGDDEPTKVNAVFSGHKYNDTDGSGDDTPTDIPLNGWTITVEQWNADTEAFEALDTALTGADDEADDPEASGLWSFSTALHAPVEDGETTYRFCEVQQTGWAQTGPTSAGGVVASSATATLGAGDYSKCYTVVVEDDATAVVGSLDFFNQTRGSIAGSKFYGVPVTGGTKLSGWPIRLYNSGGTLVGSTTTDSSGNYSFADLAPGVYEIREVQANTTNTIKWTQVAPAAPGTHSATMSDTTPSTVSEKDFGNSCETRYRLNGRTLGFWSNKNGKAMMEAWMVTAHGSTAIGYTHLANLVGANFANHSGFSSWITSASASTMLPMLKAQWMATYLNTMTPILTGSELVEWPPGSGDVRTVSQWLTAANAGNNLFISGRAAQESLKNLFDTINQQKMMSAWQASSTACTRTFPS